jgi:hypothetical protein
VHGSANGRRGPGRGRGRARAVRAEKPAEEVDDARFGDELVAAARATED